MKNSKDKRIFPFVSVLTFLAVMKKEEQSSLCFENLYRQNGRNQEGLTAPGEIVANAVRPVWINQLNVEPLQRLSDCGVLFYMNNHKPSVLELII